MYNDYREVWLIVYYLFYVFQEGTENRGERPHAAKVQGPGLYRRADRGTGEAEVQRRQVHEAQVYEATHAGRGQIEQASEGHLSDGTTMSSSTFL